MARKFVVWVNIRKEVELEFPDGATDNKCNQECEQALEDLISNGDTGWTEIKEKNNEAEDRSRCSGG